jgi:hypothetical protein
MSYLPLFTLAVKASHVPHANVSAGAAGFLESRTATIGGRLSATSTQLVAPPL